MWVTAFMDIEDLVNAESDEATRDCAEILSQEGLQATLCVVGEKARLLLKRHRDDVIAAMSEHDIGLHSDFHSVPPTIAEAMERRGWEEGVDEAIRMERPAVEAIHRAFGRSPSCWGGPGNTWGPQVCAALRELAVPAFVYAHTQIPEGGVHRFAGCVAYPNGPSLNDIGYSDDAESERQRDQVALRLAEDAAAGVPWQQVFLGHPSRILHDAFWDAPNFYYGANPPREQWKRTPRRSEADFRRALRNFRQGVRMLVSHPGIEVLTVRALNARLANTPSVPLSEAEREQVWPSIESSLRSMREWPIMPPGFEARNICAMTRERLHTLERFQFSPGW